MPPEDCEHVCGCGCVCVSVFMSVCVCACVYVCMYVCMYTRVCACEVKIQLDMDRGTVEFRV